VLKIQILIFLSSFKKIEKNLCQTIGSIFQFKKLFRFFQDNQNGGIMYIVHPCPQNYVSRELLCLARSIFFNEIHHTISLIYVVIKCQILSGSHLYFFRNQS